jgi:amino acid transporter
MERTNKHSLARRLKDFVIGKAHSPHDTALFHRMSLIAFFAWIGLGADGISSSCYGPPEAFMALGGHIYLAVFVALGTVLTIFVISTSYSQIVELFPSGGGGYIVASRLLSPTFGMISGCALIVDYVLTIAVSIASGTDAIFSFLPAGWLDYRLSFAIAGVLLLTVINLRGVKESVAPLVPIFLVFVFAHVFIILYAITSHVSSLPVLVDATVSDVRGASLEVGIFGVIFLVLRAYSMGAGTYTGLEAVSNGLPILREPRVKTAKKTMSYMAFSLAFMVFGLMLAYLLYNVSGQPGKTLNAVLFERVTEGWGRWGYYLVLITLVSEAALLFVAAQTGFLDGPRVLANMALDHWVPRRFAILSDRFVTLNGILIMGFAAAVMMLLTHGSVTLLVILYSINVFITFFLSQAGMVRHWWESRNEVRHWKKKILINGVGLLLTSFILVSIVSVKFHEGGWVTLLVTGSLIAVVLVIKRHYEYSSRIVKGLDDRILESSQAVSMPARAIVGNIGAGGVFDPKAKTAVILVNGFNGLGVSTLANVFRLFGGLFKNFVFVQIAMIDAGNFTGPDEIKRLQAQVKSDVDRYVKIMRRQGYYAESVSSMSTDIADEVSKIAPTITARFPNAVFFGGQVIFPNHTFLLRILHNYTVFAMQRRLNGMGIPFVILPVQV